MSNDGRFEAFRWTQWPFQEWRAFCNGLDAYSQKAARMLSVAVVREEALRTENARLAARVAELETRIPGLTGSEPHRISTTPMSPEEALLIFQFLDAGGESPQAAALVGPSLVAWAVQRRLFPAGASEDEVVPAVRKMAQASLPPVSGKPR